MALGKTRSELLREMSSAELSEWMAYYSIDPFGDERADLRQAFTSAAVCNAFRGKNQRTIKPSEFMPFSKEYKKQIPLTGKWGARVAQALWGKGKKK